MSATNHFNFYLLNCLNALGLAMKKSRLFGLSSTTILHGVMLGKAATDLFMPRVVFVFTAGVVFWAAVKETGTTVVVVLVVVVVDVVVV